MGNRIMEESKDLLRLDTRDIIDETAASVICQAEGGTILLMTDY